MSGSRHRKAQRDQHPEALRSEVLAARCRKSEDHRASAYSPRSCLGIQS